MYVCTHTQLPACPYPAFSVTVRSYGGTYRYVIYEVWQDDECLQRSVTSIRLRITLPSGYGCITAGMINILVLCMQALFLKAE